jgi:hypothetical protein
MKQSMNRLSGLVAASALAIGVTTAVFAAGGQGMPGYSGMMGGPWMMGGPGMMGPGAFGSVADATRRLADLKDELAIAPDQEKAWTAYEQAAINQSALMSAHRQTMWNGSMPPPVNQRATMHQQGWQMMQQTARAAEDLYKVLTPGQRARADTLLPFHPGAGMFR